MNATTTDILRTPVLKMCSRDLLSAHEIAVYKRTRLGIPSIPSNNWRFFREFEKSSQEVLSCTKCWLIYCRS